MSEKTLANRALTLLLSTLFLCALTAYSGYYVISTLLVNLANSFTVSIGTASQLVLAGSLTSLIVGIGMSAISIRIRHKLLLLSGIAIFAVGNIFFAFSPNFATALFAQLLGATGLVMILVMAYALIGDLLPLEKRGWAVGLVISGVMISGVVVAPVAGFIASVAGWRMVFLWFIVPLSIICLATSYFVLPSSQPLTQAIKPSYMQAIKKIFLRKSPIACAVSAALVGSLGVVPLYAVSFYRTDFSVSPTLGGIFLSLSGVGGFIGGIAGGRFVNRFGRKPLAVIAVFISGISAVLFTFVPFLALSVGIWIIAAFTVGLTLASLGSLSLEQVPEFRGSMMSINSFFDSSGLILGVILGGFILNVYHNNFHLLMVLIGTLGATAAAILFLLAKDPCRSGLQKKAIDDSQQGQASGPIID